MVHTGITPAGYANIPYREQSGDDRRLRSGDPHAHYTAAAVGRTRAGRILQTNDPATEWADREPGVQFHSGELNLFSPYHFAAGVANELDIFAFGDCAEGTVAIGSQQIVRDKRQRRHRLIRAWVPQVWE